jgi:hypothetical protein
MVWNGTEELLWSSRVEMNCASWCRGYYVSQHVPSADWLPRNLNEAIVCLGSNDAVVISPKNDAWNYEIALLHFHAFVRVGCRFSMNEGRHVWLGEKSSDTPPRSPTTNGGRHRKHSCIVTKWPLPTTILCLSLACTSPKSPCDELFRTKRARI